MLLCIAARLQIGGADMPNPAPRTYNVEIQGAKIISEGGYLWFHVMNHESNTVFVTVHFPSDVSLIGGATDAVAMGANESADFHFQVPYYWSGNGTASEQSPMRQLKFFFELFSMYRSTEIGTETVDFNVDVVPFNGKLDNAGLLYLTVFLSVMVLASATVIARKSASSPAK